MIEVRQLTKRYGAKTAVDSLTFTVRPGTVTGFLGPNGAGKSTTMRMILGLDRPTSGTATINGRPYAEHAAPLRQAGALLDAKAVHTGRSAYHHLLAMAATTGVPRARVDEVIDLVGLREVARKRAGAFSLGMGQRLGIASALLADPEVLILDEPVNGLDPEGILWIRRLMQGHAARGRTVFVSSHLMSEMALTAEHLVVVGRGRLIADVSVAEFIERAARDTVLVRTPRAVELHDLVAGPGVTVLGVERGAFEVSGLSAAEIGDRAAAAGIALHELTLLRPSLEEAFMELTRDVVEYQSLGAAS
ncbi:ATP-binding cassette domain-containing protein [Amorphoplanes digitatis]|uniref:ABC-2 type transport system ATP-binding protein n=1 Tax=Actinoplanes digitatis TaxID=1868 RepID=A0A7W7I5K6_9ACTN|nr:ATP-binding cassette domain-containing protein [Actinoplanes digitatis]MBB4766739.1 ABC-2 type transport system ATP-binding protein [Actinoplanes digitatis]GID96655.1 multidrug ABC transporter ATP-binding protein [Actinoplanes digitatis]